MIKYLFVFLFILLSDSISGYILIVIENFFVTPCNCELKFKFPETLIFFRKL